MRRPPAARPLEERAPGVGLSSGPPVCGFLLARVAGRWGAPWWPRRVGHAWHSGEQVGHEVGAAALPAGLSKHCGDGVLQPLVSVGGCQCHPAETPSGQRAEEGRPEEAGPENSPPLHPNESARPASSRGSCRRQALNLPWPTLVWDRRGGSAWPGGLRFGRCGYSEHRMLLVAGLPLHCTAPRQLHILPLLTRGIASQHSFRTTGCQPCPP